MSKSTVFYSVMKSKVSIVLLMIGYPLFCRELQDLSIRSHRVNQNLTVVRATLGTRICIPYFHNSMLIIFNPISQAIVV